MKRGELLAQIKPFVLRWIARGYSTADVSSPPTDAELDAAFGTPAEVGAGFTAIVNDAGAGAAVWLVASDGAGWWYAAMTQAV
ncbi:MAG: hypothetical protein GX657_09235 [Chloroflexi bacterium]|nr:hypothetical protein [Chloroflexota bacterium]